MTGRLVAVLLLAAGSSACVGAAPPDGPAEFAAPSSATPVDLALTRLDGQPIHTADLVGRMTLVVLAATYDTPSQAAVRIAAAVARRHHPRINALLVVFEPEENRPLVQAFVGALDVPFPVAMADADTLAGRGAFPALRHVPSVVLLDREGREVWRRVGLANAEVLEQALRQHERR